MFTKVTTTTLILLIVSTCTGCSQKLSGQEPKEITNSIGMKFVLIPKGRFTMGSPSDEEGRQDDERQCQVTISKDFYLGVFEVTQKQYFDVMGENPSYVTGRLVAEYDPFTGEVVKQGNSANHPVDSVQWHDAVRFCKRLSSLPAEKKASRTYRLPTEAEWEYSCRAGTTTAWSFGSDRLLLSDHAWWWKNSNLRSHAVGTKIANPWGLYDMYGNVQEWCLDWGDIAYPTGQVTDPLQTQESGYRVTRGLSWKALDIPRSAKRSNRFPESVAPMQGFRVLLEVNSSQSK